MNLTTRYLSRSPVNQPFHDKEILRDIWGDHWGVSNDIGRIGKVLMHRPNKEVLLLHDHASEIEASPLFTNYVKGNSNLENQKHTSLDLELLQSQYDNLVQILMNEGIKILHLEGESKSMPERLFTRDLGMVIPCGLIISRLALYLRYGESRLAAQTCAQHGVPILGLVHGNGFAEGGSFMMLDETTAVIGLSERVNRLGMEQIKYILSIQNIQLIVIDLPSTIIHLDDAFIMINHDMALVDTTLLPYWFLDELHRRKITLLHVDPKDPPLTINALTVAPGRVIISASGNRTIDLLARHKVEVIPVPVDEILKLGGGIHCVALPLTRE
ncbi:dimethylarginine dimethylaminohydrolase family protein [Paenibacillus crassostreae]|uniref:Amidinotransferase n=1 Tax=Paenibacillus crassostreae TaxID=1763538 RepID=A0A167FG64_9BACL|nr:arginine deiminase family protein [Paenibacillus crassostreae]AOZ94436.1 hypothetical protein LPB68_21010 [Paenibacillus crassostreae]OAB76527.1 hypothetical protein PNBC_03730 [Paenibacillus crassostreae]